MARKILLSILFLFLILIAGLLFIFEAPESLNSTRQQGLFSTGLGTAPELTKYTIYKGRHFAFPRIFKLRNKPQRVSWYIIFGENCNYDLGDSDQKDWNKLCGLFYNFFNTRDNTVMVGWRYNLETHRIELNAYYHIDKSREFTKPLLDVPLGEPVRVEILVNYEEKVYTVGMTRLEDGEQVEDKKAFFHDNEQCLEINTYFGGNETAPKTLSVLKAYIN